MKKYHKLILVIVLFTVGMLWLTSPLEEFLYQHSLVKFSNLLAGIFIRLIIFLILLVLVVKLDLSRYNGISSHRTVRDKFVLLVPACLVGFGIFSQWSTYVRADNKLLILFIISVLLIGLVEEIWIRGLVLPLIIKKNINKKHCLYYGVVFSATIFGFVHYINLYSQPSNFIGITSQVLFATSIGILFGALMLRTGNVILVSLCHAFVNFIIGNNILEPNTTMDVATEATQNTGFELASLLLTSAIFIFIAAIGLNMIRKVDKSDVLMELRKSNI